MTQSLRAQLLQFG